jgi:hypothetical protein
MKSNRCSIWTRLAKPSLARLRDLAVVERLRPAHLDEVEESAWDDARSVLKAKALSTGEELTKLWIVAPLREHAIAVHERVVKAGFDGALYPGRDSQFWNARPEGPWLLESTDNGIEPSLGENRSSKSPTKRLASPPRRRPIVECEDARVERLRLGQLECVDALCARKCDDGDCKVPSWCRQP